VGDKDHLSFACEEVCRRLVMGLRCFKGPGKRRPQPRLKEAGTVTHIGP
jgi:hypothetical protein